MSVDNVRDSTLDQIISHVSCKDEYYCDLGILQRKTQKSFRRPYQSILFHKSEIEWEKPKWRHWTKFKIEIARNRKRASAWTTDNVNEEGKKQLRTTHEALQCIQEKQHCNLLKFLRTKSSLIYKDCTAYLKCVEASLGPSEMSTNFVLQPLPNIKHCHYDNTNDKAVWCTRKIVK